MYFHFYVDTNTVQKNGQIILISQLVVKAYYIKKGKLQMHVSYKIYQLSTKWTPMVLPQVG